MKNRLQSFYNNDYKYISEFIESKIFILRKCKDFDKKYIRLSDAIDELDLDLNEEQRQKLNEIVRLFYQTEEYYFAFAYYLGSQSFYFCDKK